MTMIHTFGMSLLGFLVIVVAKPLAGASPQEMTTFSPSGSGRTATTRILQLHHQELLAGLFQNKSASGVPTPSAKEEAAAALAGVSPQEIALFSPSGYGHTAITQQGPLRGLLKEDTADQAKLTAANDKSAGLFQEADRTYSQSPHQQNFPRWQQAGRKPRLQQGLKEPMRRRWLCSDQATLTKKTWNQCPIPR